MSKEKLKIKVSDLNNMLFAFALALLVLVVRAFSLRYRLHSQFQPYLPFRLQSADQPLLNLRNFIFFASLRFYCCPRALQLICLLCACWMMLRARSDCFTVAAQDSAEFRLPCQNLTSVAKGATGGVSRFRLV